MAKIISMIDQPGYITSGQYFAITKHFPLVDRDKLKMLGRNVARNIIKDSYQRRYWSQAKLNEFEQRVYKVVAEGKPYGRASDPTE